MGVKISVDTQTLQLDCLPKVIATRLGNDNDTIATSPVPPSSSTDEPNIFENYYFENACFTGGKRSYEGKCTNTTRAKADNK